MVGHIELHTSLPARAQLHQHVQPLLLVFGLRHPKLLLVLHNISQYCSTNKDHVLPPGRIFNSNLELGQSLRVTLKHPLQVQLLDLPLQPAGQARVHSGSPRQNYVFVQLWSHVDVPGLDGREDQLRHALPLLVDEVRLEQGFTCLKPFPSDLDDPAIWQGVQLHQECCLLGQLLFGMDVVAHIAQLLLHHAHRLEISCVVKGISSEKQQFDEVPGDVPASNVQPLSQMWECKALVYRADMSHAIPGVNHDTCQQPLCVKG